MKESPPAGVALLTPPGRSAVAVLAVVGPQAARLVESHFYSTLQSWRSVRGRTDEEGLLGARGEGRIFFGRWGGPQGEEVIVCRRPSHRAEGARPSAGVPWYEGDQYVEVHCHGGRQAADRILDMLIANGCQVFPWQTWVRQRADELLQAEAHTALAAAKTQRTAAILLDQYQGALAREVLALQREIAACRDQPHGHGRHVGRKIDTLLARVDLGEHLVRPWQVLLAGRPNVGKSSLINALLGYERAIVFAQPGTTRDVLSATTAMDGWPVQLSDTAGMQETADPVELQGIRLAKAQLEQADMVVWVLDGSVLGRRTQGDFRLEAQRLAQQELADMAWEHPPGLPVLVVLNKMDRAGHVGALNEEEPISFLRNEERRVRSEGACRRETGVLGVLRTSATTGVGIASLVTAIATCLVPWSPAPGDAIPFSDRQRRLLQRTRDLFQQANYQQTIAALDELLAVLA